MNTKPKEGTTLHQKWGTAVIAEGYTVLPNVILQNQKALELKHLDVLVVMCLLSHWWDKDDMPRPAKASIARTLDVDPRTVQRSIAKLEKLGYVQRKERRAGVGDNLSNLYDLSGLVAAAKKLAVQAQAMKAARVKDDAAKQTTPKTFSLIAGGKA